MAKYPLEIVFPRSTLSADNRIKHAYPGVTYSFGVGVFGGLFPFAYSLSNAPSGMTIDASTGVVTWVNPTSNSGTVTITVTDDEATVDTVDFAVTVAATRFRWVDQVNGSDANDGILVADGGSGPWQTLSDMKTGTLGTTIVYFRGGNYNLDGATITGTPPSDERLGLDEAAGGGGDTTKWLGYPGETVTFDLQYNNDDVGIPYLYFVGQDIFLDNFTVFGNYTKAIRVSHSSSSGGVYRNLTFHTGGPGDTGGSNAGFISIDSTNEPFAYGTLIQDCHFGDAGHGGVKVYSADTIVFDRCTFADNHGLSLKEDAYQYCVRSCSTSGSMASLIGGNMNDQGMGTQGEVCFTLFGGTFSDFPIGMLTDRIAACGPTYFYRNTILGTPFLEAIQTADGPIVFEDNVIVNANGANSPWPFADDTSIGDASRVQWNISSNPELAPTGVENLAGASGDNIVDGSGLLTGTYRTNYLGLKGHEVVAAEGEAPASTGAAHILMAVL